MTAEERFERIERNLDVATEKIRFLAIVADQNEIRVQHMAESIERLSHSLETLGQTAKRLERIAGNLSLTDEELDRRLTELESRQRRKPQ
jgi:hypothetical protein